MRSNIQFTLTCSECGQELEANSHKSEIGYSSANNATANMAIKPCANCYSKATEPVRLIKQALNIK